MEVQGYFHLNLYSSREVEVTTLGKNLQELHITFELVNRKLLGTKSFNRSR